tara:strand:- start:2053 stop:2193 length:141 start_codon:yes stop_codon:yes gene_type:complete
VSRRDRFGFPFSEEALLQKRKGAEHATTGSRLAMQQPHRRPFDTKR